MTVAAQNPSIAVVAAGGQTVFPFGFRCDDATTIAVYVNDVLQPAPAVALNADQLGNPGGTVTIGARANGDVVSVERQSPQTQTVALTAYGAFPSPAISTGLDKVVMLFQELYSVFARTFRISRANVPKISRFDITDAPVAGTAIGWVQDGAQFRLGNVGAGGGGGGQPFRVMGEQLTDSGDHTNFTFANVPVGAQAIYRNGQRIFPVNDYNQVGGNLAVLVPLVAGEVLNADYNY